MTNVFIRCTIWLASQPANQFTMESHMNEKPIFIQLMEMIEDNIISGVYSAGSLIISSTQICRLYNVNPATAMRALSKLTDDKVLVKDRGIGMRVTNEAKAIITARRKELFLSDMLNNLLTEAAKLNVSKEQLLELIEKNFREEN